MVPEGLPKQGMVSLQHLVSAETFSLNREERHRVLQPLVKPLMDPSVKAQAQALSWGEDVLASLLFLIFPGLVFASPVIVLLLLFIAPSWTCWTWGAVVVCVLVLVLWPLRPWKEFCGSHFSVLFRYASAIYAWEAPLDEEGAKYLVVAPPHGVLPMANILMIGAWPRIWGYVLRGMTSSRALEVPIIRHVMTWIGCIEATKEKARGMLDDGYSLGLSPGGVAEIFHVMSANEVIYMTERKGFVKLALRTGCKLVPGYCFGNTKIISALYSSGSLLKTLSRKLGAGLVLVYGRWGLPLLHRVPLYTVTGVPIDVPKTAEEAITDALIEQYHSLFVTELRALFDRHKAWYGWGDVKLVIN